MAKKLGSITHKLREFKNDSVLKNIERFSREISGSVYLVGGALRDLFLKNQPDKKVDWDFAVSHGSLKLARKLAKHLGAFYFVLKESSQTGRVIYKNENGCDYELDFSDYRARNIKEDLRLRDFTINTLCLDLRRLMSDSKKKVIIDHFGAVEDIRNKCIRVTDERSFISDPLRILRGFNFCAQFGFSFEKKTSELARESAFRLVKTSPERICEELAKIFSCGNSYKYVLEMDDFKVLEAIFPEILLLAGVDQGEFHHLDVWRHSLQTLAELEKILKNLKKTFSKRCAQEIDRYLNLAVCGKRTRLWLLKLACILHDIGKPYTKFTGEDGRIHFYAHEKKGVKIIRAIASRMKLSGKETSILKNAVKFHLRAGQLVNRMPSERAKFRFFRDAQGDAVLVLILALADRRAMRGVLSRSKSFVFLENEIFKMIERLFKEKKHEKKRPRILNGDNIMSLLKLPPGPLIGTLLKEIEEAQALKEVKNEKQAKRFIRERYRKLKNNEN